MTFGDICRHLLTFGDICRILATSVVFCRHLATSTVFCRHLSTKKIAIFIISKGFLFKDFLEYIFGGCEINLAIAGDFTLSNWHPDQFGSFHSRDL